MADLFLENMNVHNFYSISTSKAVWCDSTASVVSLAAPQEKDQPDTNPDRLLLG